MYRHYYVELDSGEVVILEFGKVLWFLNRMENIPINPNQCRNFGIQICDDPTNLHRKLRIEASEDLFIPMKMEGSTCGIITYPPTYYNVHVCQRIILSDVFDWDPSKNLFGTSSMEEEYSTSSSFHRYINILESRVPCAPPMIQCRNDSVIHEFDRSMENFHWNYSGLNGGHLNKQCHG